MLHKLSKLITDCLQSDNVSANNSSIALGEYDASEGCYSKPSEGDSKHWKLINPADLRDVCENIISKVLFGSLSPFSRHKLIPNSKLEPSDWKIGTRPIDVSKALTNPLGARLPITPRYQIISGTCLYEIQNLVVQRSVNSTRVNKVLSLLPYYDLEVGSILPNKFGNIYHSRPDFLYSLFGVEANYLDLGKCGVIELAAAEHFFPEWLSTLNEVIGEERDPLNKLNPYTLNPDLLALQQVDGYKHVGITRLTLTGPERDIWALEMSAYDLFDWAVLCIVNAVIQLLMTFTVSKMAIPTMFIKGKDSERTIEKARSITGILDWTQNIDKPMYQLERVLGMFHDVNTAVIFDNNSIASFRATDNIGSKLSEMSDLLRNYVREAIITAMSLRKRKTAKNYISTVDYNLVCTKTSKPFWDGQRGEYLSKLNKYLYLPTNSFINE